MVSSFLPRIGDGKQLGTINGYQRDHISPDDKLTSPLVNIKSRIGKDNFQLPGGSRLPSSGVMSE
jgi:hypothetical protein